MIKGVGKDEPIVENANGGKASKTHYRMDLIDAQAILQLGEILAQGCETHGEWNWKKLSQEENINKAIIHLYAHLAGDRQDDHLGHAFCRLMMALGTKSKYEVSQ